MRSIRHAILLTVLALLSRSAVAQNAVLVTPGADPTLSLQSAIDAAADGDILVLAGTWISDGVGPVAVVDGKGLAIVAAAGTAPELLRLRVRNVPVGSTVLVRGLRMAAPPTSLPDIEQGRVWLQDCAGSVWLEDCEIDGFNSLSWGFGTAFPAVSGVAASNCAALNLERCTLRGGFGIDKFNGGMASHPATPGAAGARITNSSAALRDCTLLGGWPGKNPGGSAILAGAGLHFVDGTLLLAGGQLRGGNDLDATTEPNAGLRAEGAVTLARRGTTIFAGTGLPVVADVLAPPGSLTEHATPPRTLIVDSPLHEQQAGTLHVTGAPGDFVFLYAGFDGAAIAVPGRQGMLSLAPPLLGPFVLGALGPTGELHLPFTTPDLVNPSALGWVTLLQLVASDGGKALLEGTSAFVQLDGSLP